MSAQDKRVNILARNNQSTTAHVLSFTLSRIDGPKKEESVRRGAYLTRWFCKLNKIHKWFSSSPPRKSVRPWRAQERKASLRKVQKQDKCETSVFLCVWEREVSLAFLFLSRVVVQGTQCVQHIHTKINWMWLCLQSRHDVLARLLRMCVWQQSKFLRFWVSTLSLLTTSSK